MRARGASLILLAFLLSLPAQAQVPPVKSHREQADVMRGFVVQRFERILPELMRRHGIDMWVVITREYNDDPVFRSMAPLTTYASRRRTILVFHDRGPDRGVERLSIGRFDYDRLYTVMPTANDGQWAGLRALLDERQPKVIAINTSRTFAHADGLSHSEHAALVAAIGPAHAARLSSAEGTRSSSASRTPCPSGAGRWSVSRSRRMPSSPPKAGAGFSRARTTCIS